MIGVVIPSAGRSDVLRKAIESVEGYPLVVVDDSQDGIRDLEGISVIRTGGQQGFAKSANAGLIEMENRGIERVLLLNDDAVMEPGGLSSIDSAWSEKDGALAPVLHEPGGAVYGITVHMLGRTRLARRPGPVQALSGASLFIRASERFDSNYVHGFEDIDLCRRLSARALRVRCVETVHCHHGAGTTISRHSRIAQRHAVHGHLRFMRGGLATFTVVLLAVLQVIRERGPIDRFVGIMEGIRDYFRVGPRSLP
tara:strand:+ start:73 stop:834 length:762 start_codon:yes stop_codon:yes gene_type:complete